MSAVLPVLGNRVRRLSRRGSSGAVSLVCVAVALAAAFGGARPTGNAVLDPLYTGLLAGAVVACASWSDRASVLWLAAVAAALARHWDLAVGATGLVIAFGGTVPRRRMPLVNAMAAAFAVEAVLHWPSIGFQGGSAVIAFLAMAPAVVSGLRASRRRGLLVGAGAVGLLAVLFTVPVVISAALSASQVQHGYDAIRLALTEINDENTDAAVSHLAAADRDFSSASTRLSAWWTQPSRLVPVVAQQRQGLAIASGVAAQVTHVAQRETKSVDFSSLRYTDGKIDLGRVAQLQNPLRATATVLDSAHSRLATAHSAWLLAPLSSRLAKLESQLSRAQSSASLASEAVADAPDLLGGHGTRHYFVAFMDPPESRGLGGLLVWYAVLTAQNGHLSITQSGDTLNLVAALAAKGGAHLSGPADYLNRYGRFDPQGFFPDVSYSPDLPTVNDVVSQIWGQLGGGPLDGTLVLDPRSVADLLSLSGPVDVPGLGTLNGSNATAVLEKTQYSLYPSPDQQNQRKATLDSALETASTRLLHGALPPARDIVNSLSPAVRSGDLEFWSDHRVDQPLLIRTGLAGAFPRAGGHDLLSVVTMNAANNKIDAYLQRNITDDVRYDPHSGAVEATVDVKLTNSAPASGLPWEVIGSYQGSGLPPGTERLWFTFYSPLSLGGTTVDGKEVNLVAGREFGVNAYSGYVNVASRTTSEVTVSLRGRVRAGPYSLVLHQQPVSIPDRVTVNVTATEGRPGRDTWSVPSEANPFRIFRFGGSAG